MQHYPALTVNLDAMRQNAQVLCDLCGKNNISVAGVIKFSDGDLQVAKAYADGGCAQLAVSRAKHLQAIKEAFPKKRTGHCSMTMRERCSLWVFTSG